MGHFVFTLDKDDVDSAPHLIDLAVDAKVFNF
jgi:hypothetical protein